MRPPRKPPVIAIKGTAKPDLITQKELKEAADLQAAVWMSERAAHLAIERLRARLFHGASIEDGALVFDRELKMVRHRRAG